MILPALASGPLPICLRSQDAACLLQHPLAWLDVPILPYNCVLRQCRTRWRIRAACAVCGYLVRLTAPRTTFALPASQPHILTGYPARHLLPDSAMTPVAAWP